MANPWFKFYGGEYLADTKIMQLNGSERSCWLTLLCFASQSEDGVIKFLSPTQLLAYAGVIETKEWVDELLDKLEKLGMIRISNADVTVVNWSKRQYSESRERVKNFRKKQTSNENVTDRIEENRIDKKRIEITPNPTKEFLNNPINQKKHPEFVAYWTEKNTKGKERWEGQKFFDVKRRLVTWEKNNQKWDNKGFQKTDSSIRPELKDWTQERLQSETDEQQRTEALKKIDILKQKNPIKSI